MSDIIQNIINNTLGDGARSTKFRCFISIPTKNNSNIELDVLCKASAFPGKSTELIDFKHKGKSIMIPGQEKYEQTWELTFYLEEDHKNRKLFDEWMSGMHYDNYSTKNNPFINTIKNSDNKIAGIMGISQLNFEMDKEVCNYVLYNVFPTNISNIQTSSDALGALLEYNVTFTYTHYDIYDGDNTLNAKDIAELVRNKVQGIINDAISSVADMISDTEIVRDIDSVIGGINSTIGTNLPKIGTNLKNFLG